MAGYQTVDAMKAYWAEAGYVVPSEADPAKLAVAWNRGASVIDRYEAKFSGQRSSWEQDHAWPRTSAATYYGDAIPADAVPGNIAKASFEAAWLEFQTPGALSPVVTLSTGVKREKVGQIEIEYQDSPDGLTAEQLVALATPVVTSIEGILWLFFCSTTPSALVV